mmetsp:Transcript_46746/g.115817  ORF Transcript_46746/g.115817 Transcript_46746/m.115817 type:complete len:85 (-) Transcript_46746:153-407(-)
MKSKGSNPFIRLAVQPNHPSEVPLNALQLELVVQEADLLLLRVRIHPDFLFVQTLRDSLLAHQAVSVQLRVPFPSSRLSPSLCP